MVAEIAQTRWVQLSEDPIDIAAAYCFLQGSAVGGISMFVGTTREWTDGQKTLSLTYESYEPMAQKEMHKLLDLAEDQWPIQQACLLHRLGKVPIKEASVLVGVATAHRADAFGACRFLIDTLKIQVPIWKQEERSDGRHWIQGSKLPENPTP